MKRPILSFCIFLILLVSSCVPSASGENSAPSGQSPTTPAVSGQSSPEVTPVPSEPASPMPPVPTAVSPANPSEQPAGDKFSLWENGTQLRGANIWQAVVIPDLDGLEFKGPGPYGPPFTQEDFDRLAALGANYVVISGPGLFSEVPPYQVVQEAVENLDNLLAMIAKADMFATIAFRTGPGRSEFSLCCEGEPDFEPYYNDTMWQDQAAQDAWVEMWHYTAERYKDNPIVVGYKLMVEPNANGILLNLYDPEEFYSQYAGTLYDWNQLYPRLVEGIRQVDTQTPILIGGMGWSAVDWLSSLKVVDALRIVYVVHQYEPQDEYTAQEPGGWNTYPGEIDLDYDGRKDAFNKTWLDSFLSPIDEFMAANHAPVAVDEYGLNRWVPDAAQFMDDEMSLFEARGLNYALWEWSTSYAPFANEVHDYNFLLGPDPDNRTPVENDLQDVIVGYWSRNTIWPSNWTPAAASIGGEITSTASGTTYYVGGADCSDTGDGGEQTPFCFFETALARLQPGDTLIIKAGVYTQPLMIEGVAGTVDAPITIRGEARDTVIFDGGCPGFPCSVNDTDAEQTWDGMIFLAGGDYVTISDLSVHFTIGMGITVEGGDHPTVTNILVDGTGNGGLIVEADPIAPQIIANEITRTNLGWLDEGGVFHEGDNEAISIIRADGFMVADNNMHDVFEEGIVIKESSHNGEVHDNTVTRACAVGIYIDEAQKVRVYRNQISETGYYVTGAGQTQPCGDYFTLDEGVLGDYYGSAIQLSVGDLGELSQGLLSKVAVYQNVVWGCRLNGLETWDELLESGTGQGKMSGISIYNNVFYGCGVDGVGAGIRLEDIDDAQVTNNIIALNSEDGLVGGGIANATIANNLYFFTEEWMEPVGSNAVTGDPLFVDPGNGDFHLQAGSPAIDRGADLGLPAVGPPDIGAYEYGASQSVAVEPTAEATASGGWWQPAVGTTWQWQLDQPIDQSFDVDMYDLDLFETDAAVVEALHAQGRTVICYISAGSWEDWRPDADQFPKEVIGKNYGGWPGEKWLDIRQIDLLAPIMRARLDLCAAKGFDGVEPDNIDAYTNDTGFPLTYADQLAYNTWLAEEAHARGLSIGLKNDDEQVGDLLPYFDWAMIEDCFAEDWCQEFLPFIEAGKPVFAAEYTDTGIQPADFCPQAKDLGISAIFKNRDLDAWRESCPGSSGDIR